MAPRATHRPGGLHLAELRTEDRLHVIPHIGAIGLQQLTPTDLNHLYQQLRAGPFAFTATSGCRRGEILGLRWDDVDLDRATAMIANQITTDRQHGIVHKDMTKTHHSFVIHLDPATVGLLADWRARQDAEKEYLGGTYQDHGLVFCLEDGRPYHPDRFSREFETAAVVPTLTLLDAAELAITTINQLQKNLPPTSG